MRRDRPRRHNEKRRSGEAERWTEWETGLAPPPPDTRGPEAKLSGRLLTHVCQPSPGETRTTINKRTRRYTSACSLFPWQGMGAGEARRGMGAGEARRGWVRERQGRRGETREALSRRGARGVDAEDHEKIRTRESLATFKGFNFARGFDAARAMPAAGEGGRP